MRLVISTLKALTDSVGPCFLCSLAACVVGGLGGELERSSQDLDGHFVGSLVRSRQRVVMDFGRIRQNRREEIKAHWVTGGPLQVGKHVF